MWWIPAALMGASTLTQLKSNRDATQASIEAATYNAAEARRQALVADMQAANATERGEANRESFMRQLAQEQGSRTAQMGASGLDVNSGSNLDVLADSAALGQLDAETIRYNAAMEAWGYSNQARDAREQADLYQREAKGAARSYKLNQAGTLLSGLGSMAGMAYQGTGGSLNAKKPKKGVSTLEQKRAGVSGF